MRPNIHNLRNQAAALRAALRTPSIEGLAAQVPELQEAASTLQRLSSTLNTTPGAVIEPGTRRELEALARDLGAAGRLIAHGLAFQKGWARLLASASSGYRPDGEPVSLKAAGSISVRG
jgi:hypothetical protein